MGYYVSQEKTCFFISSANKQAALDAVKSLNPIEYHKNSDFQRDSFSWVNTDKYKSATTLQEALEEWRWSPLTDDHGNIVDVEFTGEKAGDDKALFAAIAPFVKEYSYITMQGENGYRWRWLFSKSKLETQPGKWTWIGQFEGFCDLPTEIYEDD